MRKRNAGLHLVGRAAVVVGSFISAAGYCRAATDVRVNFTLKTTDASGAPTTQERFYYVYRPDNLPKDKPAAMVLCMECRGGDLPAKLLHRKADEAGFVVVSCAISGNSTGNKGWINDDPRESGFEDIDYATEVIDRVARAENCNDAFICGVSKGGHMTCAYACVRPGKIRAAADVAEFMGLTTNIPSAPVPMIVFQGTEDNNVPYAMVKDTVDAWRTTNGSMDTVPVTTFECSPRSPGAVTQTTWPGAKPVAFVTIVGGSHVWPGPAIQTGYDISDAMWAFFAHFRTAASHEPAITSQPLANVQYEGHPASFHVAATGDAPLNYQWQRNGNAIPGASSSWYTVPPTTLGDDGAVYRVVVSNRLGSATSARATLRVLAAPAGPNIATHPQDQVTVAGQPVTFAVEASGEPPLRYQWQKNGMDIPGATAPSYTIPATFTADCGTTLRALVTDACGTRTSIPVTLTVTPAPQGPVILTDPGRARLHPGDKATFSVTVKSGTPVTYQWQVGRLTTNYVDIPGATSATYSPPPATMADHRTLFRCIATNAAGTAASAGELMLVTTVENAPATGTKVATPTKKAPQASAPTEAGETTRASGPAATATGQGAQSFTGTVESTRTQTRPRLVVGSTHYELRAADGADASVQTTLDQISRGEATGQYAVKGTATTINAHPGIAVSSIAR